MRRDLLRIFRVDFSNRSFIVFQRKGEQQGYRRNQGNRARRANGALRGLNLRSIRSIQAIAAHHPQFRLQVVPHRKYRPRQSAFAAPFPVGR